MSCAIGVQSLGTCPDKPVGGAARFVQFYNYPEWRQMVDSGVNVTRVSGGSTDGLIDDIINALGIQAWRFDVPDETALVLGYPERKVDGGIDGFDHQVNMSILGTTQDKKNVLLAMAGEGVVAVIYKKNGTGEVYGDQQGLQSVTNTANVNDPALGAVLPVQLATSPRVAPETRPPADVFKTDIATTKALIEGLNVVGV